MQEIQELIQTIVTNIVNNPGDVTVTSRDSVDIPGLTIYEIDVNPEDKGILIGKKGKTINSIRDIVRIAAIRTNQRVRVIVKDDQRGDTSATQQTASDNDSANEDVVADADVEQTEQINVEDLETPQPGNEIDNDDADDILSDEI